MKNTISLWFSIFTSPESGFSKVNDKTKILLPVFIIIIFALIVSTLLIPILNSKAYSDAMVRVQLKVLEERGGVMSDSQKEQVSQSLNSPATKTISLISTTIGGSIAYLLTILLTVVLLKILTLIFREKPKFGHLFKIIVFVSVISIAQMLIKNIITLVTDYERVLAGVMTTADLQYALSSQISLAVLFSPGKTGTALIYLVDTLTDIFNWLYYGFVYAGLRYSCGIEHRKTLPITIIMAVLLIAVGLALTSLF